MSDYDYYYAVLEWVAKGRDFATSPCSSDVNAPPQCGFYRSRNPGSKRLSPVAYWRDSAGVMHCKVGDREIPELDGSELWKWIQADPITYDVYTDVMAGKPWPDIDETVHALTGPNAARLDLGANFPPEMMEKDEATLLKEQIERARGGLQEYAKIDSDEMCVKAQTLRSLLLELKGAAEKKHKKEKEPHLEAGREVDRKWLPLSKDAQDAANTIRTAMGAWETEKANRARAAREAQEKAAREAAAAGGQSTTPPPAPIDPRPAAPIKGAYGRGASVQPIKKSTVVDQDAVYQHFRTDPEVIALLAKLAQKAVTNGQVVPGTTVTEEMGVR